MKTNAVFLPSFRNSRAAQFGAPARRWSTQGAHLHASRNRALQLQGGSIAGADAKGPDCSGTNGRSPGRLFLALFLVGSFLFTGCGERRAPVASEKLPVAIVRVQPVESTREAATEEVVGTVRAKRRSAIEAKVSGRIENLSIRPGQSVKAGELLAQLDAREFQARLDQTLATGEEAAKDLDRYTALLRQEAVTRQEFDAVQARRRVAQAAVAEAQTLLGHTRITAPFDGIITRKLAEVGDLAAAGKVLMEIEDPRSLRLEAGLSETIVGCLQAQQVFRAQIAGAGELEAVLDEIEPIADPASRTFLAKFNLAPSPRLRSGQFGRLAVPVSERSAIRVPAKAVVTRGQMEIVFIAANGRAQLRLVKTGRRSGDRVELISGVDAGESVVVDGGANLVDGQPLEIK